MITKLQCKKLKGISMLDFMIAAGIFLLVFAFLVNYMTGYMTTPKGTSDVARLRSEAFSLLSIADRGAEPANWPELKADSSTVLLMHFNNNTLDYSGLGNNGTNYGANCSLAVAGRFYSACSFDGVNDYILMNDSNSLDNSDKLTIEAWVYPKTLDGVARAIISKRVAINNQHSYDLFFRTDNKLFIDVVGSDNRFNTISSFSINTWYHIVLVYDGTLASDQISKVYINGILDKTSYEISSSIPNYQSNLTIGTLDAGDGRFFNGTIDEVAIYNRTLSAAEIYEHYSSGLKRLGLSTKAYRFFIKVNNSLPFQINQSANMTNLTSELVTFNLTDMGFSPDYNSFAIYNESNSTLPYMLNGSNVTFSTAININETKWFTVYFDDDSYFSNASAAITGVNNLTETVFPAASLQLLQYKKINELSNSNYTLIKNGTDIKNSFKITITDADTNASVLSYGPALPRIGNIIALQRYAVYQNSTAGIRNGKIIVNVW